MAKGKKTTEEKIQACLTRLQKLVVQYYKENPETTESNEGSKKEISFYSDVVTGKNYNEETGCFYSLASLTLQAKNGRYKTIRSDMESKKVKL